MGGRLIRVSTTRMGNYAIRFSRSSIGFHYLATILSSRSGKQSVVSLMLVMSSRQVAHASSGYSFTATCLSSTSSYMKPLCSMHSCLHIESWACSSPPQWIRLWCSGSQHCKQIRMQAEHVVRVDRVELSLSLYQSEVLHRWTIPV